MERGQADQNARRASGGMAAVDSEEIRRSGDRYRLTTAAWAAFMKDPLFKQAGLIFPLLNSAGNTANPGAQIARGAVHKGRWGQYNLWLYNDWFVDENNIEQPMLPDGVVLMTGPDLMGTRAYGQILDPAFN